MAFAEAGLRNLDEARFLLERRNRRAPAVAHARAQTANQLMNHRGDAAFVGHAPFDALGHQLLLGRPVGFEIELVLEITVAAAAAHRANRPHAAVFLEAASLIQDELAWTLVGTRKQVADHHGACAHGDRLRDVARKSDAAVRDNRYAVRSRGPGALDDRCDHRHAYPGDHTCGADRSGADADFDGVHTAFDQRFGAFGRRHVSRNQVDARMLAPQSRNHVEHVLRMAVRGIDDEHVHVRRRKRGSPLGRISRNAHRRSDS